MTQKVECGSEGLLYYEGHGGSRKTWEYGRTWGCKGFESSWNSWGGMEVGSLERQNKRRVWARRWWQLAIWSRCVWVGQLWGVGKPIRGGGSFRGMEAIKNLNKGCFQTPGDKYNLGKAKFLYLPSVWCIILAEEDNIWSRRNLIWNLCTDFEHVHQVGRLQIPRWNLPLLETKGGEILPNTCRNTLKFNPILKHPNPIKIWQT